MSEDDKHATRTPREPPSVRDITHVQVTKMWLKCPECGLTYERWPKEMKESEGPPENNLVDKVHECYLSHAWTPDTLEEAHEEGLVPASWVDGGDSDD